MFLLPTELLCSQYTRCRCVCVCSAFGSIGVSLLVDITDVY